MRLRTLALAIALSCGVSALAQAAAKPPKAQKFKKVKIQKTRKYKQSKAYKVKPHKAKKVKPAHK